MFQISEICERFNKIYKWQHPLFFYIPKDDRNRILKLHHEKNEKSILTIIELISKARVRDIYSIMRTIFESIVNMGLLAKSLIEEDLFRYQNHEYYEEAKYFNSLKKLGFEKYSNLSEKSAIWIDERKKEYEKKFNPKKGRWTGNDLIDDSRTLDKNYPNTNGFDHFYEFLYCQVYRNCSQVIHSSYGGIKKGTNIINVPSNNSDHYYHIPNDEQHLAFQVTYSTLIFLSSSRFLSILLKQNFEVNYQKYCDEILNQ